MSSTDDCELVDDAVSAELGLSAIAVNASALETARLVRSGANDISQLRCFSDMEILNGYA